MAKILIEREFYDHLADKSIGHPIILKHKTTGKHYYYRSSNGNGANYSHGTERVGLSDNDTAGRGDYTPVHARNVDHQFELMKLAKST